MRGGEVKEIFFSQLLKLEKSDREEKHPPPFISKRIYVDVDKDFWTIFPLSLFPFLKSRHFLKRKLTKGRKKIWEELEGSFCE